MARLNTSDPADHPGKRLNTSDESAHGGFPCLDCNDRNTWVEDDPCSSCGPPKYPRFAESEASMTLEFKITKQGIELTDDQADECRSYAIAEVLANHNAEFEAARVRHVGKKMACLLARLDSLKTA